ncbi:MAG: aspartate--tRNA ligase [Alistipes sp.]|jgi:aspartyl-tRNA synthetase|nr:aspartate--tRNA ligase [Alistipes sp.]
MYRTHTCGELRAADINTEVTLAGWVGKVRNLGAMAFIDLRDRYGVTQLAVNENSPAAVREIVDTLGREFVIRATGTVVERSAKNPKMATGEIEIALTELKVLSRADTPPFTIEENSDGGDDLRMKYRYLDLRRGPLQRNMMLRHRMAQSARGFLDREGFLEIETPFLISSTPEGARDFVVPSRMSAGQFYALPQSPQTFKQLLMVAGYDRYFQIVRCFRDEDLRADRQPEFTQIDCEMSFVDQEDVLETFERMARFMFSETIGVEFGTEPFRRMSWAEAMARYGNDKPDLRFGMEINELTAQAKGHGFGVFDDAEYIGGIVATGCAGFTRKQIDELTEYVKRPQIGAKGLVWIRLDEGGEIKSSVDKFYTPEVLREWAVAMGAQNGDLIFVVSGERRRSLTVLSELRLELGSRLGLRDKSRFAPLWVVDFPLLEWDDETARFYAMHHPFTSPKPEDIPLLESDPGAVRANAYDFVVNGVEVGGGSIRIFEPDLQARMFELLGFTPESAQEQFGFLMNAFRFGAPPHGGIAFGFDRFCSLFGGADSIRDYIAFPKNNSGRDVMIDAPSSIAPEQLEELNLRIVRPE